MTALFLIVLAIAGWLYMKHADEVEVQKSHLWQKLSNDRFSNLRECLERLGMGGVEICMKIEHAVDKAIGR